MLAISTTGIDWVFAIVLVLILQYPLSIYALMRLFRNKIKGTKGILLNIYIVAVVIVGPISYILYDFLAKKPTKDGENNDKENL